MIIESIAKYRSLRTRGDDPETALRLADSFKIAPHTRR